MGAHVIFVSRILDCVQSTAWSAILIGFSARYFLVVNMIVWVFVGLSCSFQSLKYFWSKLIWFCMCSVAFVRAP